MEMNNNQLRKILFLIYSSIFGFFKIITITQAELSVVFTDIDFFANPVYVAPGYEVFLLDNGIDNQIFVNVTIIKVPPMESTSYFKILGATMGEYKINTGFDYHTGICDLANEPIIFGRINDQMGLGGCPPKLGAYGSEAYEIDLSTLPDTFPPNRYLLNVCMETNVGEFVANLSLYFVIQ